MEGKGARASCQSCGAVFEVDSRRQGILYRSQGVERLLPASELVQGVIGADGSTGPAGQGGLPWEAEASMREATDQDPIRFRGELLGFVERFGPPSVGVLTLAEDSLRFRPKGRGTIRNWPLGQMRAVQASSSSIQITLGRGRLVSLRLAKDSTRRWELGLCEALRRHWVEQGWGRIIEFQPRIQVG
jgi:hypothetical protein